MIKRFVVMSLLCCLSASAMKIEWVQPTGQYPVENAPVRADCDGDGQPELVAVNRLGQVMVWREDGTPVGSGQDGAVARLPEGQWTSSPGLLGDDAARQWLFCSVEGKVAALDRAFQPAWEAQLPGKTPWGGGLPAKVIRTGAAAGVLACYGDQSGAITCLDASGKAVWQVNPQKGPCQGPLLSLVLSDGGTCILASLGSSLCALDPLGNLLWTQNLGEELSTEPVEDKDKAGNAMILCGTAQGTLAALDLRGGILWKVPLGEEIASICPAADSEKQGVILCTGLWGTLHALNLEGTVLWTHRFPGKTRACPALFDADGDGQDEILVPCYTHHLYVFKQDGTISDDVLLSGLLNANPVVIAGPKPGIVLITSYLLAYRLSPSPAVSPYGAAGTPKEVSVSLLAPERVNEVSRILINNPEGGLLSVNVFTEGPGSRRVITGALTARSAWELPVPSDARSARAVIKDASGTVLAEESWPAPEAAAVEVPAPNKITAWAACPHGAFAADVIIPEAAAEPSVRVTGLYQGEADQGAFVVASTFPEARRLRVTMDRPAREDKLPFGGAITLREAVPVPALNGEYVADALPALAGGELLLVPGQHAAKVWISVDAQDAKPGQYLGKIHVRALEREVAGLDLDFEIEVLPLSLAEVSPLRLCTWDYVPNKWFPESCAAVTLDDMGRHGVNVYPRTSVPAAQADAQGHLSIDWSRLDADLELLRGRGQILVQVGLPAVAHAAPPSDAEKRTAQLAYIRALRDHLAEKNLDYGDYAFYPVDEPGLDLGKNLSALTDAAELFREADPKLRIYTDPVPSLCWQDFQRIEPLIDVWCPNMRLVTGLLAKDPRIERILQSGKPVWSYECVSQVKSLSPLCYNRANAWRAHRLGLSGIGMWTHSTTLEDTWVRAKDFNDEYGLVYPGVPPVPSARWEALRDGIEDVGAMVLLEEAIARCRQTGKHPEAMAEAERALRIAQTDIMELSDLAYVETRDYRKQGDRRIWHSATDERLYRQHRQRIAEWTMRLGGN